MYCFQYSVDIILNLCCIKGIEFLQGPPGDEGPLGERGEPGDYKYGLKGIPGEEGDIGERGPPGNLIFENGQKEFVNLPPITQFKGPKGTRGAPGDQGPRGRKGEAGEKGPMVSKMFVTFFVQLTSHMLAFCHHEQNRSPRIKVMTI